MRRRWNARDAHEAHPDAVVGRVTTGSPGVPHRTRILVYTTSTGAGRRSTAQAIEAYLSAHFADTVHVRTVDFMAKHAPALNALTRFAADSPVEFFPSGRGTFLDLTRRMPDNPVVRELMACGFANAEAYIRAFKAEAVISTDPVAAGVVSELRSRTGLLAASVVTDYGAPPMWLHPDTDLYFVTTKEMRDDLVVHGIPYDRVVVSGIPIDERFAEPVSRKACRDALRLADRFTVLLTPTAGSIDEVRSLARSLAGAGLQVAAPSGHNERLHRALVELAARLPLLHALGPATEMSSIMRAADVVIGRVGGLTPPEAFAAGVPIIVYDTAPHARSDDARFLVTWGAALEAGTEDQAVQEVRFLATHPQRLAQLTSDAAALGHPAAARAVCERVLAGLR
jgi:processive 1,2-diacylglycerol beta-glucosyltransferase